jgi:hypothetical protein
MKHKYRQYLLLILVILLPIIQPSLITQNNSSGNFYDNVVVLSSYEYHIVSVNATKGQLLSGDWQVTPADVISPPFLVFILNSEKLETWETSDNLTQAVKRFPASDVLYLYDPWFRVDDFVGDNYRSGTFQVRVPSNDTWHLVLYAGYTIIPLTFNWAIDVFQARIYDIILYTLGGILVVGLTTVLAVNMIRSRKISYEEQFDKIIEEEQEKTEKEEKDYLEEIDEEYTEL